MAGDKTWTLIGANGKPYQSHVSGTLGGHRSGKIYGLFICRGALAAIARGGYVRNRVFFLDEPTAIAAGYRPCATCMPGSYLVWKAAHTGNPGDDRENVQHRPCIRGAENVRRFGFFRKKRGRQYAFDFGVA